MSKLVRRLRREDSGFTLVEMLVAMIMAAILGSILMSMLLGAQTSTKSTTATDDLNGEARAALNRISRDLRQAVPTYFTDVTGTVESPAITSVQNPDGPGYVSGAPTSITFQADFNGDGCVAGVASDAIVGAPTGTSCNPAVAADATNPEVVTYCWDGSGASQQHIYLIAGAVTAGTCSPVGGGASQPLVSGRISDFSLKYRSNLYRYDTNSDGVTTWYELDAAGSPVGNNNSTLDSMELLNVSGVVINITVANGGHTQTYQTQVDLRNVT